MTFDFAQLLNYLWRSINGVIFEPCNWSRQEFDSPSWVGAWALLMDKLSFQVQNFIGFRYQRDEERLIKQYRGNSIDNFKIVNKNRMRTFAQKLSWKFRRAGLNSRISRIWSSFWKIGECNYKKDCNSPKCLKIKSKSLKTLSWSMMKVLLSMLELVIWLLKYSRCWGFFTRKEQILWKPRLKLSQSQMSFPLLCRRYFFRTATSSSLKMLISKITWMSKSKNCRVNRKSSIKYSSKLLKSWSIAFRNLKHTQKNCRLRS